MRKFTRYKDSRELWELLFIFKDKLDNVNITPNKFSVNTGDISSKTNTGPFLKLSVFETNPTFPFLSKILYSKENQAT